MPTRGDDVKRVARHFIAPIVIIAVERGWLPDEAQHHVIEVGVIVAVLAVALFLSRKDDVDKETSRQRKDDDDA